MTAGGGAFLFKLDTTGSNLLYSTQIRSGSSAIGYGVAVQGSNAYVVGMSVASASFPLWPTAGTYSGHVGGATGSYDAFILKIDTAKTGLASLAYATRFGGWDADYAYAVAVNASGEAFVTGSTTSNDFPTAGTPPQPGCGTDGNCNTRVADAFVSKFNAAGTGLAYSTFMGGRNADTAYAISIDSFGDAFVAGVTFSPDFPVTVGALRTSCGSNGSCDSTSDAFAFCLDPTGTGFYYSTYLGGRSSETARGIVGDDNGYAVIVGDTDSTDFPVTADAIQPAKAGTNTDAFTVVLDPTGAALSYSSYLGGTGNVSGGDKAFGVAIDPWGNGWVVGQTDSSNFPVVPGAVQPSHGGGQFDGFVVRIGDPVKVTGVAPGVGATGGGTAVSITGQGFLEGASATFGGIPATSVTVTAPTTMTAVTPAHAAGTVDVVVTNRNLQSGTLVGGFAYSGSSLPTFTDDPLQPQVTRVKAIHLSELRVFVAALRTRYGLAPATWTDSTLVAGTTVIKAAHLTELRAALAAVYVQAGRPVPTWTTPTVVGGATVISAVHIAELRAAILSIWQPGRTRPRGRPPDTDGPGDINPAGQRGER